MIIHIFNSSVVSGPETLAIPALKRLGEPVALIFLTETRLPGASQLPVLYAKELGHEVHTVPVRGRWDRKAFKELRQLLDRLSPRVAHAHDVKASLYLYQASRQAQSFEPLLASTHHGAAARKGKIRLYEEYYVRFLLPYFHAVFCVCEGDRLSLLKRGLKAERLHIHYNGVDRDLVSPEDRSRVRSEIRTRWRALYPELPEGDDQIYLGAIARLSSEKRHDRMLEVMKSLNEHRPDLHVSLLCYGIGAEEARLKEMTARLGLKNVHWLGYSKTIGQETAGLDWLLCLSDGEGIPINLIEAGWSGTPVLSTKVGGIPDLIDSPKVGLLVEKSDANELIAQAMIPFLENPEMLRTLGRSYQKRITTQFSERAWLDRLREVYALIRP